MPNFLIRIELYGNYDRSFYPALHMQMQAAGYSSVIQVQGGNTYVSPSAEFIKSTTQTTEEVARETSAIAKSLWEKAGVIVVEYVDMVVSGLEHAVPEAGSQTTAYTRNLHAEYTEPGVDVSAHFDVDYSGEEYTFSNVHLYWHGEASLPRHPLLKKVNDDWDLYDEGFAGLGEPGQKKVRVNSALATAVVAAILEKAEAARKQRV